MSSGSDRAEHRDGCCQSKTLGGRIYTLCPSQLIKPGPSLFRRILQPFVLLALSPLLLTVGSAFSAVMFLGPKSLSSKITSMMIPRFMQRVAKLYSKERKTLLLPETFSKCKVLDLGSGGGAYMRYLSPASQIVALEPLSKLHPVIKDVAAKANVPTKQLQILDCGIEDYIEKNPDQVGTFDWIILGNVLCEVPSQTSTLLSVDQLLKVGGRIYFSEHIGYPKGTMMRFVQDLLNPWWRVISGGCNCNRDTLKEIKTMKNWEIISWNYTGVNGGPPVIGPFEIGLALKLSPRKDHLD